MTVNKYLRRGVKTYTTNSNRRPPNFTFQNFRPKGVSIAFSKLAGVCELFLHCMGEFTNFTWVCKLVLHCMGECINLTWVGKLFLHCMCEGS